MTILSRTNTFFNDTNYTNKISNEFAQTSPLAPSYTWDTESKVMRVAKQILSIIIFPIGLYNLLHMAAGKLAVIPASTPSMIRCIPNHANNNRNTIALEGIYSQDWKYKRISVSVNGTLVDAVIVGKKDTINNGRWMLASNGNGEFYEDKLLWSREFKQILTELNGNALVFNYPGVGASGGIPTRKALKNTYQAMLNLLEDKQKGIGAKEIIGYGHSIGGAVQGDALTSHQLKPDVKYTFVKSRTFSNLADTASQLIHPFMGWLVKLLGWNMDNTSAAKKLKAPEIILQSANVSSPQYLATRYSIVNDRIIPQKCALAYEMLNPPSAIKRGKTFIGVPENHNQNLNDTELLTNKINELLK